MPVRTEVPPTRRQKTTNFGDAISLSGGQRVPICTYSAEQSDALAVYVECSELDVPEDLRGTNDFRLMVTCDWGSGNASTVSTFDCTYRQRIPLVGASCELSAWIAAFPYFDNDGTSSAGSFYMGGLGSPERGPLAAPAGVKAKARIFVAEGADAVSLFPSFWMTQQNTDQGIYIVGQGRLATFKFWASNFNEEPLVEQCFLHIYDNDQPVQNGDVPIDSCPIRIPTTPILPQFVMVQGQTRAFVHGLSWALSRGPYSYLPVAGPTAFTTAEFQT